jgi:hypothetical protein
MARLGLALVGIVLWASARLPEARKTPGDYWRWVSAAMALTLVRIVGLAVDCLPDTSTVLRSDRLPGDSGSMAATVSLKLVKCRLGSIRHD